MIGTAVEVVRRGMPEDTIRQTFEESKLDLPVAPSEGLFLDKVSTNLHYACG